MKFIVLIALLFALAAANCPNEGEEIINGKCFSVQTCYDHLGALSALPEDNESITNTCEPKVVSDVLRYEFTVSYIGGYRHHADCLTQTVRFEKSTLPEVTSNRQLNEWQFNAVDQEIKFDILHDELENYGCSTGHSNEQYYWECGMTVDIKYQNSVQLTYNFIMEVKMPRTKTDDLTVTVRKNKVEGDCCENTLNVLTDLSFCTDFTCNEYIADDELTFERKQDLYVEHYITSPEFQYLYLQSMTIKLGPFVPEILAWNGENTASLIYHFQSNVALPNMKLEVISRLIETSTGSSGDRRMLAQAEIGDDYKIKAESIISIEDYAVQQEKLADEKSENTVLIAVVVCISLIVVFAGIGATVYFLKKRNVKAEAQQSKYEINNKQNTSVESQC